ncbi:serine hydrolase domain-containing protein [Tumebacillus flagellatus]|uniref:Beta-lactamase-related domain-containing protein n=1 Tax=Tumebacillus flagellatus TaxID=1157490 RepID=A0A074LV60_9BACL|nr:serine hydrolase domain-containing protein [Tumebacillus flagellatus]KEO84844.1 hypothetical protein EL26_02210 [Tumebacillus flagellatus]
MDGTLLTKIDALVEAHRETFKITGASLAIVQGEEIAYARGYGRESILPDSPPVTADTIYRIASVTKPLTASMILRLVEEGVLELDKPVREYVPWLELSVPGAAEKLTLRLLLSHQSGLPTGGDAFGSRDPEGLEKYVREYVPTIPMLAEPGTGWSYSNHNFNIAGYIAEAVTGKHYAKLMKEYVFEPLGMERTTFDPLVALTYPIARPHLRDAEGELSLWHNFYDAAASAPAMMGLSTVLDLAQVAKAFLQGGGSLLKPETVETMLTPHVEVMRANGFQCGLSWFILPKNGKTRYYHYGQASYMYTSLLLFSPEDQVAVAALGNGEMMYELGHRIMDLLQWGQEVPEAEPQENPDTANPAEWPLYTGTYLSSTFEGLVDVFIENDELMLRVHGETMNLLPLRERLYFAKSKSGHTHTVGFPIRGEEPVRGIMMNGQVRGRANLPEYTPNPADWTDWLGLYDDGEDQYEVWMQEDQLAVHHVGGKKTSVLDALSPNLFLSKETGLIRLQRLGRDTEPTLVFHEAWRLAKVR